MYNGIEAHMYYWDEVKWVGFSVFTTPGNLVEFEIAPENTANLLEFS